MKKRNNFAILALSAIMATTLAAAAAPGAPVTLGEKIGLGPVTVEAAQETVQLPDGWYYIKNVNAQKYLQVAGDRAGNVTNVEIRQGSGSAGQKWYLQNRGNGYVTLKSGVGNFNLDIANGSSENNANAQIYDAYNGNAQQFMIQETGTANIYAIASRASDGARVLDAEGRGTDNGTNVLQWAYNGGTNQQWVFEPVSGGSGSVQPSTRAVAAIGDELFDTLQDAVDAADTGHRIRLLKPVDISATGLYIPKSKKITLDLAEVNANPSDSGEKTVAILTGTGDKGIIIEGGFILTDTDDEESIIATKDDSADALFTLKGNALFYLHKGHIDATGSGEKNGGSHAIIANDESKISIKADDRDQAKITAKTRSTIVLNDKSTLDARGGSLLNLNSVVVENHSSTTLRFNQTPFLRSGETGVARGSYVLTTDKGHVAVAGGIFKTDARVSCLYASGTGTISVAGGYYRQDVPEEQIVSGFGKTVEYIVDDNPNGKTVYYYAIKKASEITSTPTPTSVPASESFGVVYATNLSLKGKVGLNIYLNLPKRILEDEAASIEITRNGKKDTFKVSDLEVFEANKQKLVSVTTYVTAKEMSDDINLKVIPGNGGSLPLRDNAGNRSKNGAYTTSVAAVLAQQKASGGIAKNLRNLYNALETYGQYAQLYFKHNSDGVVPEDMLTDVEDNSFSSFRAKKSGKLSGVSYLGGNLILDSDTTLMVYFKSQNDLSGYKFTIDGKEVEAERDVNYYILTLDGIEAKNLDKAYDFAVSNGKNTLSVKYSALTYADSTISQKNTDLINLMKAMYKYNVAADAYFK